MYVAIARDTYRIFFENAFVRRSLRSMDTCVVSFLRSL